MVSRRGLPSDLTKLGLAAYDANLATAARAADVLDEQAVRWVGRFVGFAHAEGSCTSSGQSSNLTALLAARERALRPACARTTSAGVRPSLGTSPHRPLQVTTCPAVQIVLRDARNSVVPCPCSSRRAGVRVRCRADGARTAAGGRVGGSRVRRSASAERAGRHHRHGQHAAHVPRRRHALRRRARAARRAAQTTTTTTWRCGTSTSTTIRRRSTRVPRR